jgi:hypothetical protein
MISNCHKNIMGTTSFDGKFAGMRQAQDFIVYPMHDSGAIIQIQSDTRIGRLNLNTGELLMSRAHPSGAYASHLMVDKVVLETLPAEDVQLLRQWIKSTGGIEVGESFVKTDNTGAMAL